MILGKGCFASSHCVCRMPNGALLALHSIRFLPPSRADASPTSSCLSGASLASAFIKCRKRAVVSPLLSRPSSDRIQRVLKPSFEMRKQLACGFFPNAASHVNVSDEFPSIDEIISVAKDRGLNVEAKSFGLSFRVTAKNLEGTELGRAESFVVPWTDGWILHLEYVRMTPLSTKSTERPVLGIAFLLGAVAIRHGYDCNCTKAELLAINDCDTYHSKLVRYYTRLGFRAVHEVTGESWRDIFHMLMWGGVGTRMDADILELLRKWSPAFRISSRNL